MSSVQYDKDPFQIWSKAAGYGELWVWFQSIRNGEIQYFEWIIIYIITEYPLRKCIEQKHWNSSALVDVLMALAKT